MTYSKGTILSKGFNEGKTKDLPDLTMEELPPELQAIRKRVRGD